jgi:hypothetical protein
MEQKLNLSFLLLNLLVVGEWGITPLSLLPNRKVKNMKILEVKYFPEFNGNRELPEENQMYAMVTPVSAKSQNSTVTNELINKNLGGKKEKIDYASMSLEINKKHCPKIFNVIDPITEEVMPEMNIEEIYEMGQFKELYEELSAAVGEWSKLKTGLKKK